MEATPVVVVGLVTRCDFASPSEGPVSAGTTHFNVVECALLSDGREITLLDDRGWGTTAPLGETVPVGQEPSMIAHVVRSLYTCVLPDNAEETGEGHEFGLWVQRLREAGVEVTADELRAVPRHPE